MCPHLVPLACQAASSHLCPLGQGRAPFATVPSGPRRHEPPHTVSGLSREQDPERPRQSLALSREDGERTATRPTDRKGETRLRRKTENTTKRQEILPSSDCRSLLRCGAIRLRPQDEPTAGVGVVGGGPRTRGQACWPWGRTGCGTSRGVGGRRPLLICNAAAKPSHGFIALPLSRTGPAPHRHGALCSTARPGRERHASPSLPTRRRGAPQETHASPLAPEKTMKYL